VAQPFLLFGTIGLKREEYLEVWKGFDHFPKNDEVIRSLPVRNPAIWFWSSVG
jgi:hypothetical protein